jgi:hypothetical protein
MAIEDKVKHALKKGARKLHTHEVTYRRADNGGIHAKVARHTKEGHHHTEDHVLANFGDAQKHFQENLGDQPDAGAMPPQQEAPAPPDQMAGAGADAGGGAMPPPQGM